MIAGDIYIKILDIMILSSLIHAKRVISCLYKHKLLVFDDCEIFIAAFHFTWS